MSQTPIKVEYPLEEVLGELKQSIKEVNQNVMTLQKDMNQKFEMIQKDINDLKVGQTELKTEVRNLKEDVKEIKDDIKEVKTVQNSVINEISNLKGVKSLIIPIVVAVSTALLTLLVRLIPNVSP